MLNCRACLWRCLQALDAIPSGPSGFRRHAPSLLLGPQKAMLRTVTRPAREGGARREFTEVERLYRSGKEPWKQSPRAAALKSKEKKALTRQAPPTAPYRKSAVGVQSKTEQQHSSAAVKDRNKRKRELQYLADPLELAVFVKKELGKDRATEMVQLVQMASQTMRAVVGWNHIIDYYLAKGKVSHAINVYNDMKKRQQFPDSYTYTILLRGLSINAHESGALGKALSIYHSMSAPNSRVEPSIIHTNAVLKVCARAVDMDALWGIVGKIPEKGAGSANAITYVTIINAIRQSLLLGMPVGETAEQLAVRKEQGVVEGRRIWEEIVAKWRNADLIIEEELVCAMGRLLLIGARPRDWDDVLSLVEQTMDIPRFVPRLGSLERTIAGFPRLRTPDVPEQFRFDDDHLTPTGHPPRGDEFLPVASRGFGSAVSANPLTYATPSNNTLSVVMEACLKVVANKAAERYWNTLTDPTTYAIKPDINNLNLRLRLLRQVRNSANAVKLLTDQFQAKNLQAPPGTFRIAMSTCVRDANNHNSLKHAGQILDIMTKTLEDADPKAVSMYAELAIKFPLAKGPDLVDALARLDPVVRNIRLQLSIGGGDRGSGIGFSWRKGDERSDALTALRRVYGLYDRLINSDLIPEEEKKVHKREKARLASFLSRHAFKYEQGKKVGKEDEGVGVEGGEEKNDGGKAESRQEQEKETPVFFRKALSRVDDRGVGGEKRKEGFRGDDGVVGKERWRPGLRGDDRQLRVEKRRDWFANAAVGVV